MLPHQPRHDVVGARARGKGHEQAHRAIRPGLRERRVRNEHRQQHQENSHRARVYTGPRMKLRVAENFRAVFYAPFYAIRALGLAEREGLAVDWLPSDAPRRTIEQVKRRVIDAHWGGPMPVVGGLDSPGPTLRC